MKRPKSKATNAAPSDGVLMSSDALATVKTATKPCAAQKSATVLDELRNAFRPEFINRIDEIVVFHALTEAELNQIVEIQLNRVRARLADRRITLEISDEAKTHLAQVGYEPAYGARPLKRAIQREVETHLGRKILAGEVRDGDHVRVDADRERGGLTFSTVAPLPEIPSLA
jgi:ATP-dependent Clp protease ATP-binding subunit ClpB